MWIYDTEGMWTNGTNQPTPGTWTYAQCIRCRNVFTCHADPAQTLWVHAETLCPLRPNGEQAEPGEPGTTLAPACPLCLNFLADNNGATVAELFPHAQFAEENAQ